MATRIEAQASFSNSEELDQVGGNIATGQTAVVGDEYAEELERSGLAEIIDTDVNGGEDRAEAESIGTVSSEEETTGEETDDVTPSEENDSEESASEEEAPGEEVPEEDPFEHTEYVDRFATLTEEIPHYEVLAESSIETFDDLAEIADDFQVVKGIGPMKADDLSEAWDEILNK